MKFVFAGTVTIKNLTARHASSVYLNRALIPIGMVLLSACTQMPKVAEKAGAGANASKPVVAAATVASPTAPSPIAPSPSIAAPKPPTPTAPGAPTALNDAAKSAVAALTAAITPNPLRSFADVTKGAKVSEGFIPVWQKEIGRAHV